MTENWPYGIIKLCFHLRVCLFVSRIVQRLVDYWFLSDYRVFHDSGDLVNLNVVSEGDCWLWYELYWVSFNQSWDNPDFTTDRIIAEGWDSTSQSVKVNFGFKPSSITITLWVSKPLTMKMDYILLWWSQFQSCEGVVLTSVFMYFEVRMWTKHGQCKQIVVFKCSV